MYVDYLDINLRVEWLLVLLRKVVVLYVQMWVNCLGSPNCFGLQPLVVPEFV